MHKLHWNITDLCSKKHKLYWNINDLKCINYTENLRFMLKMHKLHRNIRDLYVQKCINYTEILEIYMFKNA